jgi:ppGpp synthetase/RelA/SpoT-type nucleotidyltranferase
MNTPEIIQAILSEYDAQRETLSEFVETVRRLLDQLVEPMRGGEAKRIHLVTARLKSRDSLKAKLERQERNDQALSDITDVCGARIITYYADDVEEVGKIVEREFVVDWENSADKGELLASDRFGYLSVHYVVTLSPSRLALPEYKPYDSIKAEIQVRSILQHAWAEIERGLGYRNRTIPGRVRRRFSMLSGLLELADKEFRDIREDLDKYVREVIERIRSDPASVAIDRESIRAYILSTPRVRQLDEQLAAVRGATVDEADERTYNLRAMHLQSAGFATIGEVDGAIKERESQIVEFGRIWLKDAPHAASVKAGYCLFFLCYLIAAQTRSVDNVRRYLETVKIKPRGESLEQVATRVVEIYNRVVPEEPVH